MSSMIFLLLGSWGRGAKERSLRTWNLGNIQGYLVHFNGHKSNTKRHIGVLAMDNKFYQIIVQSKLVISQNIYLLIQNRIPPVPEYQSSSPEVALLSLRQMQPSRE